MCTHTHTHTVILSHTETKSRHHSWPSSVRHFRKSSFRASGLIWFLMPPSRLEVASDATIRGRTTVGGICRRTPPTAPGRPFCSWPRDATSHRVWAASITPWRSRENEHHAQVGNLVKYMTGIFIPSGCDLWFPTLIIYTEVHLRITAGSQQHSYW